MLESLLSSALLERSGHAAVVYEDSSLSFGELGSAANRLAAALKLEPGDRVVLVSPNVPALVVGLFACWQAGALAVPLSARLRHFELGRAFADAEPTVAVSVPAHAGFGLAEEIASLAQDTPTMRGYAVVDELGEVLHAASAHPSSAAAPAPPELAAILYTSGTTGEPKGALVPHRLAHAMAANLSELLGADGDAPYGLAVPASHAFGLGCLLAGVAGGATAVLAEVTTSIDPLVSALRRHGGRVVHGTPALLRRWLGSGADLGVRTGLVAGSLCPPELLQDLDERGVRILDVYGTTELGAAAGCRREDPATIRHHTVGRALAGYELRIAPVAEPGEPGEIEVRSDHLPSGYHRRPWSDDELTGDGWFRTGDLGRLDEAGNLTISGRAKEVVHVGGFNVFPAEIEAFLLSHPAIAQAAVIGAPHPVLGEAPQAFVVPAPGVRLEPRDVVSFARAGIAGYKVPYAVRVVDELPLLPSGKPDRRALAGAAQPQEVAR